MADSSMSSPIPPTKTVFLAFVPSSMALLVYVNVNVWCLFINIHVANHRVDQPFDYVMQDSVRVRGHQKSSNGRVFSLSLRAHFKCSHGTIFRTSKLKLAIEGG